MFYLVTTLDHTENGGLLLQALPHVNCVLEKLSEVLVKGFGLKFHRAGYAQGATNLSAFITAK